MKILLNFVPLKSGGGVQVGLDFIHQAKLYGKAHTWHLVVTEGTPFSQIEQTGNVSLARIVPKNMLARMHFEYFGCVQLIKELRPAVVYTQFGRQWPGSRGSVNIVGCAYSNLFYPEIDFWGKLSLPKRWLRKAIDSLRKRPLHEADAVIFETHDLAERAVRILGLAKERVHVVRPSVSSLVSPEAKPLIPETLLKDVPSGFRVLLLSVYNPNKNFELLPDIARILSDEHGHSDVVFIVTLPQQSGSTRKILQKAMRLGVRARLHNVGPVPPELCGELYRACDAVILPSQLESFSNTIVESWIMRRPLLISDMGWARAACGNGAIYFKYADARDAAQQISALSTNERLRCATVERGRHMLATYPTPQSRFLDYLKIIEKYAKR